MHLSLNIKIGHHYTGRIITIGQPVQTNDIEKFNADIYITNEDGNSYTTTSGNEQ